VNKDNKSNHKKRVVRKRNFMPVVIIILGLLLGGTLIGIGIYNNVTSDYDALKIKTEEQLKEDVIAKTKEVEDLRKKRNEEYGNSAKSEDYEKYSHEITVAEGELYDLSADLYNVQNGVYDGLKREKIFGSVPFIAFGAAVIVIALGIVMKMSTKKKNVILTITEDK
jgi:cell division protein FtsB